MNLGVGLGVGLGWFGCPCFLFMKHWECIAFLKDLYEMCHVYGVGLGVGLAWFGCRVFGYFSRFVLASKAFSALGKFHLRNILDGMLASLAKRAFSCFGLLFGGGFAWFGCWVVGYLPHVV